jgi:hypothetical protein
MLMLSRFDNENKVCAIHFFIFLEIYVIRSIRSLYYQVFIPFPSNVWWRRGNHPRFAELLSAKWKMLVWHVRNSFFMKTDTNLVYYITWANYRKSYVILFSIKKEIAKILQSGTFDFRVSAVLDLLSTIRNKCAVLSVATHSNNMAEWLINSTSSSFVTICLKKNHLQ